MRSILMAGVSAPIRRQVRFASDSPLEEDGFELSVPGHGECSRLSLATARSPKPWVEFAPDSPLEEARFEPSVPLTRGLHAVESVDVRYGRGRRLRRRRISGGG